MTLLKIAEGVFLGVVAANALMGYAVPFVLSRKTRKMRRAALQKLMRFEQQVRAQQQGQQAQPQPEQIEG